MMNRISIKNFHMLILALLLIMDSGCMWVCETGSPFASIPFGMTTAGVCIIYFLSERKYILKKKKRTQLIMVCVGLLTYIVLTHYNFLGYFKGFFLAFLCYYLYTNSLYSTNRMRCFLDIFSKIVCFIAALSLFFWLFGSILQALPGRTSTSYEWADKTLHSYTYLHLYYENPIQNIGQIIPRNLGIFTEAPAHSSIITYALLIEFGFKNVCLKEEKRLHYFKILFLTIVMVTTQSAKGIIALLIIYYLDFVFDESKKRYIKHLKIILGVVLVIIVFYVGYHIAMNRLGTGSGELRIDDIVSELSAWKESPLWGVGYENDEAIWKYQIVKRDNGGLSMGLTLVMSYGGILLLSFYLYPIFQTYRSETVFRHKKIWMMTVVLLGFNLFISNCGFSNLFLFILAAGYTIPTTGDKSIAIPLQVGKRK